MSSSGHLVVFRLVLGVGWAVALLIVLSGSMPENPLPSSLKLQQNLIVLFPQGWAFFTRDPREPTEQVYRRSAGGLREVSYANSSARNFFGLRRDARAVHVELVHLLSRTPIHRWQPCDNRTPQCAKEVAESPVVLSNDTPLQQLCGDLIVVRRPPVPWAWSRARRTIHMPGSVLSLRVRCNGPGTRKSRTPETAAIS